MSLSRRKFTAALPAILTLRAQSDWVSLFNGRNLEGWRANENAASWRVEEGCLTAQGPRSHLFYAGAVEAARFRNFEFELEARSWPLANSGVYFHTGFQEQGWPARGFEVQVNNTATGEGGYLERRKTGSLYGVRNQYKTLVRDNEWFKLNILVRGKNVQIRVNGTLSVDYTEPDPPLVTQTDPGRVISAGTFALQGHDPGSRVQFRSIRVRPLPDGARAETPAAPVDAIARQLLNLGAQNLPVVDYHAHLKSGLTIEQLLERSRASGVYYGVAVNCGQNNPVQDDAAARRFVASLRGQPVFCAMQAEGREWTRMFSTAAAAEFDYIFTDSMTWTDNRGRRMRLWMPNEVGTIPDAQEFMETLVARTVGIFNEEPVDIYVNPTFLPDALARDYDKLWTEERMRKVVRALKANGVALELNDRYRLPGAQFVRMGKEEGVKFSFGTNNGGAQDLRRCDYGLEMVAAHRLAWQDFFVPAAPGARAIDRRPKVLKG